MSWRQGFFRIWVLLSVLWALLVAFFAYDGIVSPWFPGKGFYYKHGVPVPVSVDRYSTEFSDLVRLKESGEVLGLKIRDLPEITLFVPANISPIERDRRIDQVHGIATTMKATVVHQKRVEAIKQALAVVLIPPIMLFVIGLGIAWAISGFRQKPTNPVDH